MHCTSFPTGGGVQNRYTIQIVRSPSTCKRWLIASGDDSAGPPRAERSAVFGFQVRNTASNDHSIFVPAPSPPPQPPLSPNTPPPPLPVVYSNFTDGVLFPVQHLHQFCEGNGIMPVLLCNSSPIIDLFTGPPPPSLARSQRCIFKIIIIIHSV